jgi:hypothetical protein
VPYLRDRVKPAQPAPAARTRVLIAELDDDRFEGRKAAAAQLRELGHTAAPAMRAASKAPASVEQKRRLDELLAALGRAGRREAAVRLPRPAPYLCPRPRRLVPQSQEPVGFSESTLLDASSRRASDAFVFSRSAEPSGRAVGSHGSLFSRPRFPSRFKFSLAPDREAPAGSQGGGTA